MPLRHDVNYTKCPVMHHATGQFPSGDEFFTHQRIGIRPVGAIQLLRRKLLIFIDNQHSETRPLIDRLKHVRRLHRMVALDVVTIDDQVLRNRYAGGLQ